jgi:hypothetical protein
MALTTEAPPRGLVASRAFEPEPPSPVRLPWHSRGVAKRSSTAKPDTRAVWLNGTFLVLGAVIAATAGALGPLLLQSRQDRRDERREAVQARGAARLLFVELTEAGAQQAILANDRKLRHFDPSYDISMRAEDMRLIASKLPPEQWATVMAAIVNAGGLETYVNTLIERDERTKLSPGEACLALNDLRSIRFAAEALANLADAPGKPQPPEPLNCTPAPRPGGP